MNYVPNWLPPFANLGARYRVVNWQGSGQDYLLYSPGSIASRPALPAVTRDYPTWCPEAGLTTAQCFARYGLTYGGGIVGDADVVTLDGISGLVAKAGFVEPPLGPPRTVLTYPNRVMPAVVSDGRTMLHFALTGARDVASDVGVYQIDNGPILKSRNNHGNPHDDFVRQIPTDAVADGEHTVRTWREDGNGKILRGTEMTFTYFVGRVPVVASAASESRR
jgi:hypothetical protein